VIECAVVMDGYSDRKADDVGAGSAHEQELSSSLCSTQAVAKLSGSSHYCRAQPLTS
jgi:hypothetical protein